MNDRKPYQVTDVFTAGPPRYPDSRCALCGGTLHEHDGEQMRCRPPVTDDRDALANAFGRISCAVHAIDGKGDNTSAEDVIARIKAIVAEFEARSGIKP